VILRLKEPFLDKGFDHVPCFAIGHPNEFVHVSFREFAVKKRMREYARRFLGKGGLSGQSS
jgi:hypothetical protein